MKRLETFINEKLRVTKSSGVPNLISILESKNEEEYDLQRKKLAEYLKDDSGLPIAEMEDFKNDLIHLSRKYQNGNDVFLWVGDFIFYGTWDKMYFMEWNRFRNRGITHNSVGGGFRDFACNEQEIMKSNGVFIITENTELTNQVNVLLKKSEQLI